MHRHLNQSISYPFFSTSSSDRTVNHDHSIILVIIKSSFWYDARRVMPEKKRMVLKNDFFSRKVHRAAPGGRERGLKLSLFFSRGRRRAVNQGEKLWLISNGSRVFFWGVLSDSIYFCFSLFLFLPLLLFFVSSLFINLFSFSLSDSISFCFFLYLYISLFLSPPSLFSLSLYSPSSLFTAIHFTTINFFTCLCRPHATNSRRAITHIAVQIYM